MMTKQIKLYGRVFIQGTIKAVTGLHIGGSDSAISIGGMENIVIRDTLTQRPYIPGSSLKGKMRSLAEKKMGLSINWPPNSHSQIHACEKEGDYQTCDVCHVYGVPAKEYSRPTRIIVRDVLLSDESAEKLADKEMDLPFTEVKYEAAIDRITSEANPRPLERVPAGAEFGIFEIVFSLYEPKDAERLGLVIESMQLLEDDYLGGSGSRGSGKIAFTGMNVTLKRSKAYTAEPALLVEDLNLEDLSKQMEPTIKKEIDKVFSGG
jgi:CRISPR-associated protein Csm3